MVVSGSGSVSGGRLSAGIQTMKNLAQKRPFSGLLKLSLKDLEMIGKTFPKLIPQSNFQNSTLF